MSEEINVRKVCLACLYGGLLLVAGFSLISNFSISPNISIIPPLDLVLVFAVLVLYVYIFFVALTLFVIIRFDIRLSLLSAFLTGFLQSSLVLLIVLPPGNFLTVRTFLVLILAGLIGVFIAWFGGFLRTTSGMPSP